MWQKVRGVSRKIRNPQWLRQFLWGFLLMISRQWTLMQCLQSPDQGSVLKTGHEPERQVAAQYKYRPNLRKQATPHHVPTKAPTHCSWLYVPPCKGRVVVL